MRGQFEVKQNVKSTAVCCVWEYKGVCDDTLKIRLSLSWILQIKEITVRNATQMKINSIFIKLTYLQIITNKTLDSES